MKLLVLLVTLLVLSWTSAEDVGDQEILQQHNEDNNHKSELGEAAPQRTDNETSQLGQETPTIRVARAYEFSSKSNLEWVRWNGHIPSNAVKISNTYVGREDYVCRVGCEAGYYTPKKGPSCFYPYGFTEQHSKMFHILVNRDNFEILEWKWKTGGEVPENAVKACRDLYVAKNKYGLGKLHQSHHVFYLPWKGTEYKYNEYYVLNVNMDVVEQKITNVRYNMKGVEVHKDKPETLRSTSVKNYQCREATKQVTLEKSTETSQSWDVSNSITLGVSTEVSAGIPNIADVSVAVSAETSVEISHGTSKTESTSHSLSVSATIPPNSSCSITMEGCTFKANIPFTGRLTRKYSNGKVTSSSVKGIYKKVQVGEIQAVLHRCDKIADAKPC
uniref:Natterin-4 n=1 Tax=Thalassophryne nattereri TaxID=289382 RepID=NATT4_THANI|nr:RecName: Full=Natterin-4; Flags: Precursor [Thalassophryne nattereri]AAU11825.1 natterin 4 precursor [Thalassophryne nattereri]